MGYQSSTTSATSWSRRETYIVHSESNAHVSVMMFEDSIAVMYAIIPAASTPNVPEPAMRSLPASLFE